MSWKRRPSEMGAAEGVPVRIEAAGPGSAAGHPVDSGRAAAEPVSRSDGPQAPPTYGITLRHRAFNEMQRVDRLLAEIPPGSSPTEVARLEGRRQSLAEALRRLQ